MLSYRGKDGEPVLGVEAGVVAVAVDPCQLNLVTRPHLQKHQFQFKYGNI